MHRYDRDALVKLVLCPELQPVIVGGADRNTLRFGQGQGPVVGLDIGVN